MTPTKVILRIDPEFKQLISPLSQREFEVLESNIVRDGCREPISIWDGVILDGHNRYAICRKLHIPFSVVSVHIASRQDAISWICENQLGRRNISEETRKYLIGKRYEAEKHKDTEKNLYRGTNPPVSKMYTPENSQEKWPRTSDALGHEYHLSFATVQKYGRYAKAIDILAEKHRVIVPKILSGQVKLSQDRVIELAQLPERNAKIICQQICSNNEESLPYLSTRKILSGSAREKHKTVKDMPDFDPDAEVSILTLTIPSWRGIMGRAQTSLTIHPVSSKAKMKLRNELESLFQSISELMNATSEV